MAVLGAGSAEASGRWTASSFTGSPDSSTGDGAPGSGSAWASRSLAFTMQVKGVSRFVAVELDEIDEFAPESIGKARDREAQADPLPGAPGHVDESGEPVKELAVHRPDVPAEAAPADESPAEPVADEV